MTGLKMNLERLLQATDSGLVEAQSDVTVRARTMKGKALPYFYTVCFRLRD